MVQCRVHVNLHNCVSGGTCMITHVRHFTKVSCVIVVKSGVQNCWHYTYFFYVYCIPSSPPLPPSLLSPPSFPPLPPPSPSPSLFSAKSNISGTLRLKFLYYNNPPPRANPTNNLGMCMSTVMICYLMYNVPVVLVKYAAEVLKQ